jgi:Pyruvate/2-oxoacid:ferredoxin oxidoreductase delta subunit
MQPVGASEPVTAAAGAYEAVDMVVWSGTGNTLRVAERLAEAARSRGAVAHVLSSTSAVETRPTSRLLLGLLAPTHGFTAPWPLVKAAVTLRGVRGVDVFVLVTRGGTRVAGKTVPGFEGTAAYLPAAVLAVRGAHVRGVGAIDMPLNWTVVVPAFDPEGVAAIVDRGDAQTDAFSDRLLSGNSVFGGRGQLVLGILILPLSLGYMLIARLMLAKMFFADERCTSCGTCERHCPQGAVRLIGRARRPYWTYDCQNCMRCMSNCPTDAIQGGQGWLLFYVWLISVPVAATVATVLLGAVGISAGWLSGVARFVAGYLWIVASVWLAYAALWLGLLVPGLRFVLSRATLTRLYRRYRGPRTTREAG